MRQKVLNFLNEKQEIIKIFNKNIDKININYYNISRKLNLELIKLIFYRG
jgi:hypothetical protein